MAMIPLLQVFSRCLWWKYYLFYKYSLVVSGGNITSSTSILTLSLVEILPLLQVFSYCLWWKYYLFYNYTLIVSGGHITSSTSILVLSLVEILLLLQVFSLGFPFFRKKFPFWKWNDPEIFLRKPEFRDDSGINGNRKFSGLCHVNWKNFQFPFRKPEKFPVSIP